MKKTTRDYAYTIFIVLFIALNVLNTYFLTSSALNKYIAPFSHTFIGELTAIIGNVGALIFIILIVSLVIKSMRARMVILIVFTLILNSFIFVLGIFNLYYGTAFAVDMLNLFNNPTGGFAGQTAIEAFRELISYYRIVVFIPFFTLTIWTAISFKQMKGLRFKFNYKRVLTQLIAVLVVMVATSITFTVQVNSDMPIQSAVSSYSVQNYGVYPYYIKEFLGIKTKINSEDALNIKTDEDALSYMNIYNKNVSSYVNPIDGITYSNRLTMNQADIDYIDPSLQNGDELQGILKDKNLVLIHLESFNYFLLQNQYTNAQMSFLNNLLNESYVLSNYYANVGMGVSSDAEFSVLTGLNPQGDKTLYWDYSDIVYELPSIPQYLTLESYYTESIHGDHETFYNRNVVYPNFYNFSRSYSLEDFMEDGYDINQGYLYDEENQLTHVSPWVSDYYLGDCTATLGNSMTNPFMLFPIYMMGHTPFDFGPYGSMTSIYPNYAPYIHEITLKYLNYANYYSETIKRFFIAEDGTDQTISDTAYIFYSDHGSGLKNGDLDILLDKELSELEERQILQQTLAFIYVPSNDEYVDYGDYSLRKGMLVGDQERARSPIDLYRTMVELFDMPVGNDAYFGVNVLSTEPTFVLDNRLLDVVTDQYFYSLRQPSKVYPTSATVDVDLYEYIRTYKMYSDYLLSTKDKLKELNALLNQ